MKLTWFGGTTIRIHIGGAILVVDPGEAPTGIDATELVSGADKLIADFGAALPAVDTRSWKARKPPRLLDESDDPVPVQTWSAGQGAILVDAMGEPPLLLLHGNVPPLARWTESAVLVVFGAAGPLLAQGQAVLADTAPRLLVLAGDEPAIDAAIPALRDLLDGTGLVALEASLALEI